MPPSRSQGDSEPDIPEVVPDYTEEIWSAIRVLAESDSGDHAAVVAEIVRARVASRSRAVRLYQLIPIAWGRVFLQGVGVIRPGEYIVHDSRTGKSSRHRFATDPLYQQIQEVLPRALRKFTGRRAERVLGRSPEVNAFRQMAGGGSKPGNLLLVPPILAADIPEPERRRRRRGPAPGRRLLGLAIVFGFFALLCAGGMGVLAVFRAGGKMGLWKGIPQPNVIDVERDLESPDLARRARGLRDLKKLPPDPAQRGIAEALRRLLQEGRFPERKEAAQALGAWGRPEDAEALAPVVARHDWREAEIREAAIASLGQLGGPKAAEVLAERLAYADDRPAAAAALEKIGAPAEPAVLAVLERPEADEDTRLQAIQLLGQIGTERSLAALRRISGGKNPDALAEAARRASQAIEGRIAEKG